MQSHTHTHTSAPFSSPSPPLTPPPPRKPHRREEFTGGVAAGGSWWCGGSAAAAAVLEQMCLSSSSTTLANYSTGAAAFERVPTTRRRPAAAAAAQQAATASSSAVPYQNSGSFKFDHCLLACLLAHPTSPLGGAAAAGKYGGGAEVQHYRIDVPFLKLALHAISDFCSSTKESPLLDKVVQQSSSLPPSRGIF